MKKNDLRTENFFINNVFVFENSGIKCEILTEHNEHGEPTNYLVINKTQDIFKYAYGSKVGLVKLNDDGSIQETNILGSLLAINDSSIFNYLDFFNNHGFLLSFNSAKPEKISEITILSIIKRLRSTLELFSNITFTSKTAYEKIIHSIFYLLFSPVFFIESNTGKKSYMQTYHPYTEFYEKAFTLEIEKKYQDTFNNSFFEINDSVKKKYVLNSKFIKCIQNNQFDDEIYNNNLFKHCLKIYLAPSASVQKNIRLVNDFIFHYLMDYGMIKEIDDKHIFYFNDIVSELGDELKKAATTIGKYILKTEIESNLEKIKPTYNIETLTPAWKIDSLLSALYFGLFYMNPKMEIYRQCACKTCNKFFVVSTTSQKKKYCSKACQNRDMQARYRVNHK